MRKLESVHFAWQFLFLQFSEWSQMYHLGSLGIFWYNFRERNATGGWKIRHESFPFLFKEWGIGIAAVYKRNNWEHSLSNQYVLHRGEAASADKKDSVDWEFGMLWVSQIVQYSSFQVFRYHSLLIDILTSS